MNPPEPEVKLELGPRKTKILLYHGIIFLLFWILYTIDMYRCTKSDISQYEAAIEAKRQKLATQRSMKPENISLDEAAGEVDLAAQWNNFEGLVRDGNLNIPTILGRSFYFTAITHTTVGYGDYYPAGIVGRVLVVAHIMIVLYITLMAE